MDRDREGWGKILGGDGNVDETRGGKCTVLTYILGSKRSYREVGDVRGGLEVGEGMKRGTRQEARDLRDGCGFAVMEVDGWFSMGWK